MSVRQQHWRWDFAHASGDDRKHVRVLTDVPVGWSFWVDSSGPGDHRIRLWRVSGTRSGDTRSQWRLDRYSGQRLAAYGHFRIHNFLNDTDTRPFFSHDTSWTTQQNFSLNRTRHDIRFGFEGIRHVLNHYNPDGGGNGGPMGRFDFTQGITSMPGATLTQYNSYAAFLLGLPQTMRRSAQFEVMTAYNWQLGWYLRDRWQANAEVDALARSSL